MTEKLFWDSGDVPFVANLEESVREFVAHNVKSAYEHIFQTSSLWLCSWDGGKTAAFEVSDENHEFRQVFPVDELRLMIDTEEERARLIKTLELAIELVRNKEI